MRLYAFELHLLQTRIERCRHTRLQSLGYIRCWSSRDDHYADGASCLQSYATKLRRSLDAGYLALTSAAATSAGLKVQTATGNPASHGMTGGTKCEPISSSRRRQANRQSNQIFNDRRADRKINSPAAWKYPALRVCLFASAPPSCVNGHVRRHDRRQNLCDRRVDSRINFKQPTMTGKSTGGPKRNDRCPDRRINSPAARE